MKKTALKISSANKPQVTISLKPHLADYCRYLFETTTDGAIILRRNHDFGKHIPSFVQVCETPVRRPLISNPVTFILPITKSNHYALTHSFYYVSKWGEERIHDYIEAEFKREVRNFFEIGYEQRYTQKEICEAILKGFNLQNNALNFEAIKKIDYRNRQKKIKKRFLNIQCAVL